LISAPLSRNGYPLSQRVILSAAKKPRRAAQQIPKKTWEAIKSAILSGAGYAETGRRFGVSRFAIMMHAKRCKWPVGPMLEKRIQALQQHRYTPPKRDNTADELATELVAESWAQRAEEHKNLAFRLAHSALKKAEKSGGIPLETARDADLLDRIARRSAGLDTERDHSTNLAMSVVCARIDRMVLGPPPNSPSGPQTERVN
jgi:hypothetical protein